MVYKWTKQFTSRTNSYKLAERLIPRMNGTSCNHFRMCGSLPSAVRVFQQTLTVESNSWTTPLVLHLPSLGNISARYCWNGSMLIASGSFSDWSVTTDRPRGPWYGAIIISRPLHVQAHFLTAPAYWPAFWLCAPLTSFKSGRPVYNPVERLTNGSTVNNWAVTYIQMLAQNWTAVIKINCLATLSNKM